MALKADEPRPRGFGITLWWGWHRSRQADREGHWTLGPSAGGWCTQAEAAGMQREPAVLGYCAQRVEFYLENGQEPRAPIT